LLHDNDVRNVPNQVVVESVRDFVELFQSMVLEEFGYDVPARFGNRESVAHFFKFSLKINILIGK